MKSVDVNLNPKGEPDDEAIVSIVHDLRPEWNKEYETQNFQGGSMNLMIKYWKKGDMENKDAIMVRIMGELSYLISEPDNSILGVRALAVAGCAPKVLCIFNNGYVYDFLPGERVSYASCSDDHSHSLIAKEMAKFHKVDAAGLIKTFQGSPEYSTEPQLFPRFTHFLSHLDENMKKIGSENQEDAITKNDLIKEVAFVKSKINLDQSKVVMQHGDLYPGNFLLNEGKDEIKFIDYEWVGYNYQAFDLAYFLNTQFYFPYPKMEVTFGSAPRESQVKFFRTYLATLHDKPEADISVADIEALFKDCKWMGLATLLYRAILCYALEGKSVIPIDLMWFGNLHLEEYFKRKSEYLQ